MPGVEGDAPAAPAAAAAVKPAESLAEQVSTSLEAAIGQADALIEDLEAKRGVTAQQAEGAARKGAQPPMSAEERAAKAAAKKAAKEAAKEAAKAAKAAAPAAPQLPPAVAAFERCDVQVTEVLECKVPDFSEKLLVMKLRTAGGDRTFAAGVAQYYKPEDLVGKKLVTILNLKPRPLAGGAVTSEAMLFAGSQMGEPGADGQAVERDVKICFPPQDAPVGTRIVPKGYTLAAPAANPKKHFDTACDNLKVLHHVMCLDGIELWAGEFGPVTCECSDGSSIH